MRTKELACPKCGSHDIACQMVTDTHTETRHHGLVWKILVGWWWLPLKWIFFTMPAACVRFLGNNRHKVETTSKRVCVCQKCGYYWAPKQKHGRM